MKRSIALAVLVATVVLAFAGTVPAPAPAQPLRPFVVTEPVHSLDSVPFYLAVRKGFFKELGLDVKLVTSEGGGRHIAAVISGDANAFIGGPEHIAFARVKGGKELRAVVSMSNRASQYFVAGKSVTINDKASAGEKLRGKRIAIGTRGGTGYSIVRFLLAQDGIDPTKDVVLVEIPTAAGRMAAIRAGQADVAMINEPLISQGMKAGLWNQPFMSMPAELGPFVYTTINLPLDLIQKDPAMVAGMVKAMVKALEYTFAHPEEAEAVARAEFPTLPVEDVKAVLKRALDDKLWERNGSMPKEAWARLHEIVRKGGLLERDVAYEEVFEPKFLR
ncbi:MAG: ABC transporter substrate-binding protein [Candidatus Rokuibacteriota bacterium]